MKYIACAGVALSLLITAGATAAERPNVVFLFADDMGWGDARCYGHPHSVTPNIDALASQGTRFLQCYATGITCCPSRTGFMTSTLPATFATYPANGGFGDRVTITELLKRAGYATGHFGKWHIGPTMTPGTYGIDRIGTDEPARRRDRDTSRARDAHVYDQAIAFIEEHRDGPFYVNVWGHVPHHPVDPAPELVEAFGPLEVDESLFPPEMRAKFDACRKHGGDVNQHMLAYLAELKALDAEIGRLLDRLDDLGLREKTIVVFSSDQGPEGIREENGGIIKKNDRKNDSSPANDKNTTAIRLNAMGYSGPFRGGKHYQYEGGVRIPFIVRWPGHVPAGRVDSDSVISGADWLPTLCALAEVSIDAADFAGEDASKAWLGGEFSRTKPLLWKTSAPQSAGAIRVGQWKLHYPNSKRGELELYDLSTDAAERHNVADEHADVVARLSKRIEAWQATLPTSYEKTDDRGD